jgi:hypothetical protein
MFDTASSFPVIPQPQRDTAPSNPANRFIVSPAIIGAEIYRPLPKTALPNLTKINAAHAGAM